MLLSQPYYTKHFFQRKEDKNRTIKGNSEMVDTSDMGDESEWETIDEPETDHTQRRDKRAGNDQE